MDPVSFISSDILTLLGFVLALASVSVGYLIYRRARSSNQGNPQPVALSNIVYRDAPTVRVSDSQHFDRLRKVLNLSAGEEVDILHAHPVVGPRFRVSLHAIVMHGASDAAHLTVVFHGQQVSCGPLGRELGYNEFYIPRAARDEARSAIFHYTESDNALDLMRIKVNAIDASRGTAQIEVMQMRGNWPGSED
jgi:hypothetical protein